MKLLPLLSIALLAGLTSARAVDPEPLTTAAQIRALPQQEANEARPVRISGTVTHVVGNIGLFFVQDGTGSVAVIGQREKKVELKPGTTVEVEGITASGQLIPHVTAKKRETLRINVTGETAVPDPLEATIAQLAQPAFHGVRVEVRGTVRAVQTEPAGPGSNQESILVTLADGRDRLAVAMPGWRPTQGTPRNLIGAEVKVRGVFSSTPFEGRALFANRLLATTFKDMPIEQPGEPMAELEQDTVAEARFAADDPGNPERVRLHGTITAVVPGKGMFVEDSTAGLWIDSQTTAARGEVIDVAGFPAMRENSPLIEDAMWEPATGGQTISPPLVTAQQALGGELDGRLVQIEALLLTVSSAGEGTTFVLQSGDRVFLARCADPRMRLPSLAENSWLRITGVCVNARAPQIVASVTAKPVSFHLLMPGPQSIQIARTPSWWTLQRIVAVFTALAALALAAVAWATTLRRQVARQTEQIREHLAKEAVSEERLRIARELHDSVQQDLLGITMQLKATDRLLDSAPDKAHAALNLASAMVRRSQAETHRAVWDLRESAEDHADLARAVSEMCNGVNTNDGPKVESVCIGEPRALPATIESQVLRVAQEAVTNALKHACASFIAVELHFAPGKFTLTVRDDGRGFDADHPPSTTSGHFGLFGMKERAIKLDADLRVTSQPGAGTAVHLSVPVPAEMNDIVSLRTPSALRFIARPSTS
jgi:signal transduction histidine kinase